MYNIHGCLLQVLLEFRHKGGHLSTYKKFIKSHTLFILFFSILFIVDFCFSFTLSSPFFFAKCSDQDTNENEDDNNNNVKGDSKGTLYYGTITTSKPLKSNKGILLWRVQYGDNDSEDFDKEEVVEAIDLYKLCTKHQ